MTCEQIKFGRWYVMGTWRLRALAFSRIRTGALHIRVRARKDAGATIMIVNPALLDELPRDWQRPPADQ